MFSFSNRFLRIISRSFLAYPFLWRGWMTGMNQTGLFERKGVEYEHGSFCIHNYCEKWLPSITKLHSKCLILHRKDTKGDKSPFRLKNHIHSWWFFVPPSSPAESEEQKYSGQQGGFNCSSLPAGLGRNEEFKRKLEEIWGNNSEWSQPERTFGNFPDRARAE